MPKPGKSAASKTGDGKAGMVMAGSKMTPSKNSGNSSKTTVGIIRDSKKGK